MVVLIASIYGVGIVIAILGVLRYRSKMKEGALTNTSTKVENTGSPLSGGVDYLKIICK